VKVNWQGIYPAVASQFREDQTLDVASTLKHLDTLIKAGVHGLIMLGTVGENCSLEYDEKLELLRATVAHVGRRVPVLAGVAEYTTAIACRFARDAQRAGVDGLMVLPAMVYKADRREAIAHFRAVARATDLPVMCYNNPATYGVDLPPEAFSELADESTLVAIKESSDDPRRITDIINLCGDRYTLFCGVDDLIFEAFALGAQGWVAGLANAFPHETVALWNRLQQGKLEEARTIYRWFTPLLHLDTHPKLVQYIKLAMAACGHGTETVRAPRLPLVGDERDRVLGIIQRAIETRPALATKAGAA
jgi:dihydrodipicolinate synthase/N-acetylneuraminate lyase